MSEEQQPGSKEYSFQVVTLQNTIPPTHHNQANMPRDSAIYPPPEISHDDIFVPPPSAHPACCEPHRVGYAPYYGPIMPSDGVTHTHHRAPCAPQPTMQLDNIASAQCGTVATIANRPPVLGDPFGGIAENTPVPSGRPTKRARQDFNDAGYNPAIPRTSMASINRDLAVRFVNDPNSKITMVRMESSAGRSKVMIEVEIDDAN